MRIEALAIDGAFRIAPRLIGDARGAFARVVDRETFAAHGIPWEWVQMNTSRNPQAGTVRGLHYQRPPYAEGKLVRCVAGRVLDVFVDLRAGPGFGTLCQVELDAAEMQMVYIPPGCAHGFQTLTDDVELHYCHTQIYAPEYEGGVSVTDLALAIDWPLPFAALSDRDKTHPLLSQTEPLTP